MRAISMIGLALGLVGASLSACNCGLEVLETPVPRMIVNPRQVALDEVPVAQDTRIVIQISNTSIVDLSDLRAELPEGTDPSFRLEPGAPDEVFAGQTGEVVVVVRPRTVTNLSAVLILTAQEDAEPASRVEVPIAIQAVDAGMPDICNYPESVVFGLVGQGDVARAAVPVGNCGVRDLLLDSVCFIPTGAEECDAASPIALTTSLLPGQNVGPASSLSLDLVFVPPDLEEHGGDLVIESNDPDESPLLIPVTGRGSACPTAVAALVDDPNGIEPFDTVRIDGRDSLAADGEPFIGRGRFQWSILQRPVGSPAVLRSETGDRTELPVDLAGRYVVELNVFETVPGELGEIRSCEPAVVTIDVVPTEELLIQLVWDHPTADLDLHLVRDGGQPFNHDDDAYFSNREPAWYDDPAANPHLDHDDDEGYGPENLNIIAPAPGSRFRVLVHYWNKQTDASARARATVRVFVYGLQVIEVSRTFESDQQLWQALDITWPEEEGAPASLSQIGIVEPFARPF